MRILLSLLTSLLMIGNLHAAQHEFRFSHIQVENDLSSNYVRAIAQDLYGFIWIGTDEGLNRYDGKNIKLYRAEDAEASEYISSLYNSKGTLWVGTEIGVYTFNYEKDILEPLNIRTENNQSIKSNVCHIAEDKDGNLWFSTIGQGLFKYNPNKQWLEQYEFRDNQGVITYTMIDNENQVWVISNYGKNPIFKLNKAENNFEPFPIKNLRANETAHGLTLFEDTNHQLWVGTWESGLLQVDKYSGAASVHLHPKDNIQGTMHIHSIMEYAPHKLLIGSDDGLLLYNTQTEEHQLFTEDDTNIHSLSNRFVYPIIKDHEGGIWVGTYYGGVNYLAPNSGQFEAYQHSSIYNSVSGSVISSFCEDEDGRIWIASDDGGLNCFSPQDKHFTHYLPDGTPNSLSYHNVHALCVDGDNLWIGTYSGGVNVLNKKTGRFKVYNSVANDPSTLDGSSSYAIFKDREDRIWVSTMSGVNLYNRDKDNFTRVKSIDALIIDIDQDTKGNLWFTTQGKGVFKYNPERHIWKSYTNTQGGLASNYANCTIIDKNGQIWLGTMNGLQRYNLGKDCFELIELTIPNQNICGIVEDRHILWLTTGKGLVRYAPDEPTQIFMKNDGLQSDQFLLNSIMKAKDGKIYMGTANGFNAFHPHQIKTNQTISPVVITDIELFNKRLQVGDERLPQAINQSNELHLSHKDHTVSLLFASLSYCTPEKNQYAYKLEGFDNEWNYIGSQNKATYTNLTPGTYTFKVKATNNDGVWNEKGSLLKITIHPPFYWNFFSKLLYAALAFIALTYFIRTLLKRSEIKHTKTIKELNENKEYEVREAKINFFTTIAHEIRTPVSLIIGPLEKIMRTSAELPEFIRHDLDIIDRNSQRLLFLVNQLLDFRKVEKEGLKMKFASYRIGEVVKAVCERFKPSITHNGKQFEAEYPDENFTAVIDSEAITKLVSNLLTNANKYTKDYVKIECKEQPDHQTFVIKVSDNGMGISKDEQKKIFKPFYQAMDNKPGTGIGLSIVKSIVEAHNGSIEVKSEVGKGSSFIVTLPITQPESVQEASATTLNPSIPEDIIQESLPTIHLSDKKKPNMLIVDDNEEMLNFLTSSFTEKYTIFTAEDGLQALSILKENEMTLIVSDWMMPNMNGVELCKAVRANQATSHIPFILLTAKTDNASKIEGMDCGADAYIEKPFSVQYLEACIKNLVDLRTLLHKKFSQIPTMPLASIANNSTDDQFLHRMNDIIEENFSNPELSVDFLAERLCISRSGLFAKIKTLANITPNELIQVVRLKKAAALLLENKYRINEICYMIGFNNPSYFSKCFQKQFGMKPGEFASGKGIKLPETGEPKN